MSWEIELDGELHDQAFATEAEANQAAANIRGQDWGRKIVVREAGKSEPKAIETGKQDFVVTPGAGGAGGSTPRK